MCGRYTLTIDQEALQVALGVEGLVHPEPRYNIAPTQKLPVIVGGRESPEGRTLAWGFVPSWAKDPSSGPTPINARSETVAERPAFRDAFRRRRCLVPADGFYEWRKGAGGKVPYLIGRSDGEPFTFAGIWDRWSGAGDGPLETFAILTRDASETLRPIHHRMPVIIPPDDRALWLDASSSTADLRAVTEAAREPELVAREVSTHVNSPANDDPRCVEPVAGSTAFGGSG